jgi:putative transcriptional regulator
MSKKTLGQILTEAVKEALHSKKPGKVVRPHINVVDIRRQLNMTQKEFSENYYIKLQTLRNWEQEKRSPDSTALAYLTCIAQRPKEIFKMLHPTEVHK